MADISTLDIVDKQDLQKQVDFGIAQAKRFFDYIIQGNADLKAATTVSGINGAAQTANTGVNGATSQTDAATKASKQLTLARAQELESLKAINTETRNQAKILNATAGSIDQLKARYALLNAERNKTPLANRNSDEFKNQTAQAAYIKDIIDKSKESVGDFTGKVGNYTGAIKVLQDSLVGVTTNIAKMTAAGKTNTTQFDALIKEQTELKTLLNGQAAGFTSVSREILSIGKALQTLQQQGLQDTEEFKKLNAIFIANTKSLREFRNDQALLSSEAPKLQALTLAAKGLAGGYAVGTAAVSLFGDESGKLAEKLNQLVAIQTVLQGLTELNDAIMKKSAISTALFGESATIAADQVDQQSDAVNRNTTSKEAANTVTEETTVVADASTVTTEANTTAIVEEGVAMDETAASSKGLAAALEFLEANPIIIALTALAAILIVVYENIDRTEENLIAAIKAETVWADAINATTEAIKEQTNLTNENTDATIRNLEQKLAVAEKEGTSQANIFAIRKQISALEAQEIKKEQDNQAKQNINQADVSNRLNKRIEEIKKLRAEQEKLATAQLPENGANNVIAADGSFTKENTVARTARQLAGTESGTTLISDRQDEIKKELDVAEPDAKALQKTHDDANALAERAEKNHNTIEQELAEERKFTRDQETEQILADANLKASIIKENNDRVLANEKSTIAERLAARQSSFDTELELRKKQQSLIDKDPTKSQIEKDISFSSLQSFGGGTDRQGKKFDSSGQAAVTIANTKDIENDSKAFLAAQERINAAGLNLNSQYQEELYKNQSKGFTERTLALAKYNLDQQALIQNAGNAELEAKGLFAEEGRALDESQQAEKIAIETETANKLKELAVKAAQEQQKIIIDSNNQLTAEIDRQGETGLVNKEASDFKKSKNNKEFQKQKKIDEDNARNDKLQNDLVGAQNQANDRSSTATDATRKEGADKASDIKNQITANATQTGVDTRGKKEEDQKVEVQALEDFSLKSLDTLEKAEDQRHENKIKHIEAEIAATQKAADIEKTAISDSTLNALDKTLAIQKIDKDTAAQKAALTKQENREKAKQAQTDKAITIAKITLSTAEAAIKAYAELGPLGGVAGAALAVAEGALELTVAEGVKIPSYYLQAGVPGKPNHPGGPLIFGDKGTLEKATLPSGQSFIANTDTMLNAPANTRIEHLYGKEAEDYLNSNSVRKINLQAIKSNNDMRVADRIVGGINNGLRGLRKDIQNIPAPNIHIQSDLRRSEYIQTVVKGRRR